MISQVQLTNNSMSLSQEIEMDIQKALELIEAVKKQDTKTTKKELDSLLIEYILANMKGDSTEAHAIQDQISQLLQTYVQQNQHANELEVKLQAMEKNPSGNSPNDLAYLQSLIVALQQDMPSGDMSNLYPF